MELFRREAFFSSAYLLFLLTQLTAVSSLVQRWQFRSTESIPALNIHSDGWDLTNAGNLQCHDENFTSATVSGSQSSQLFLQNWNFQIEDSFPIISIDIFITAEGEGYYYYYLRPIIWMQLKGIPSDFYLPTPNWIGNKTTFQYPFDSVPRWNDMFYEVLRGADINDENFGLSLAVTGQGTAKIYCVGLNVTYQTPDITSAYLSTAAITTAAITTGTTTGTTKAADEVGDSSSDNHRTQTSAIIGGSLAGFLALAIVTAFVVWRKRRSQRAEEDSELALVTSLPEQPPRYEDISTAMSPRPSRYEDISTFLNAAEDDNKMKERDEKRKEEERKREERKREEEKKKEEKRTEVERKKEEKRKEEERKREERKREEEEEKRKEEERKRKEREELRRKEEEKRKEAERKRKEKEELRRKEEERKMEEERKHEEEKIKKLELEALKLKNKLEKSKKGEGSSSDVTTSPRRVRSMDISALPKNYDIEFTEIKIKKKLGNGQFGEVVKGYWRNHDVAVKQIRKVDSISLQAFIEEAQVMLRLRPHGNIVQLLGICRNPPAIVMRFYENGSLLGYLQDNPNLPWKFKLEVMSGIAAGMAHLHAEGVIHRDLAARNVLLSGKLEPIVSDFGFARLVQAETGVSTTYSSVGPLKHMPPESLTDRIYSTKTDAYAFGITCYEILSQEEPYKGLDNISTVSKVLQGYRMPLPETLDKRVAAMILKCWSHDPDERPSLQNCHDILKGCLVTEEKTESASNLEATSDPYESMVDIPAEETSSGTYETSPNNSASEVPPNNSAYEPPPGARQSET
eukprot:TRINITY_DN2702_c0_g3_i1.p1 TRINITY_DN2702_c0_g3~~TRINITY_DN2702_c0_g3_i1.p1  ORF type:complete len:801 (-),score=165.69 TRINITY_DN2702_c0_g3_i1:48-2450(-)